MPLTAVVAMPCGFDDAGTLMDFDSPACWPSISATNSSTSADYDPDPLFYGNNKEQESIISSAGSKTQCSKSSGLNSTSSYCRRMGSAARQRPSGGGFQLWSPRLRQRDERKRVLKLSLAKLRRIDDAESCLRRSVLLNNTLRRLQREARDEKSTTTASTTDCSFTNNQRLMGDGDRTETSPLVVMEPEACSRLQESLTAPPRAGIKRRRSSETTDPDALDPPSPTSASIIECLNFSDLYLPPPTPRMISSLDEVSEDESTWCGPPAKRPAKSSSPPTSPVGSDVNKNRPALRPCNSLPTSQTTTTSSTANTSSSSSSSSCSNQNSSPFSLTGASGLSLIHSSSASGQSTNTATTSYSCGQSSLFGELQSVVFHSLITSLES